MTLIELIPIGTILSLLTDQLLETATAARDVLVEKESFQALSKYLCDIEPVLKQLQLRELNDTQATRQALNFLKEDVKKAKDIVDKYKNRARFYLLVKCRSIVKEIQDVTRDIGKSLAALSLASTEILSDLSDRLNRIQVEMQKAEFEASHAQLRIVEKLDQGLREKKSDQNFANNMLEEIAIAVGVAVEPSEISGELSRLKREKEEAAVRKEKAEEIFLAQVIELLSHADAAIDEEEIKDHYQRRVQTIEKYSTRDSFIHPLKSFRCPITKEVMVDPVSLCTGTTCERTAISAWLENGQTTDPETFQVLKDFTLRSNIVLKKSIEEYMELNYCLKIRSAKAKLESDDISSWANALHQLQEVINDNIINKDWIALEGLIEIILLAIGSCHNKKLKKQCLLILTIITKGHARNKVRVVESGGLDQVVTCLGRSEDISKAAIELLYELLYDGSKWNDSICSRLKQQTGAILYLVMLLNGNNTVSAERAQDILWKLCQDDDEIISQAASFKFHKPLIDRLNNGPQSSRILMAKTLIEIELIDFGGEELINPLMKMASGNLESKTVAYSALAKLLDSRDNKKSFTTANGVPLIIEETFATHNPTTIAIKCFEILEKLTSTDGVEFLIDADEVHLEFGPIVTKLASIVQNSSSSSTIRKLVLRVLMNICMSKKVLKQETVKSAFNATFVLPMLEDHDHDTRELALKLLYHLSQHESDGIADFLLDKKLDTFIEFLKDDTRSDLQMVAAGLLSHLPKNDLVLTKRLVQLNVLPVLLNMLNVGSAEAKENALGSLFRFVNPSNIEMQRMVLKLGAYPLILSLLKSGSLRAKARAAALISNLSMNSAKLTVAPVSAGFWCFRAKIPPICEVHGGICDVNSNFCLLKTCAVPVLVQLLQEHEEETSYEALQALGTLIENGLTYKGARFLHESGAIDPMLNILSWGSSSLKEMSLVMLQKLFHVGIIADEYCTTARIPLIRLSTQSNENGNVGRMAARVLAELEPYSKPTSMPLL